MSSSRLSAVRTETRSQRLVGTSGTAYTGGAAFLWTTTPAVRFGAGNDMAVGIETGRPRCLVVLRADAQVTADAGMMMDHGYDLLPQVEVLQEHGRQQILP